MGCSLWDMDCCSCSGDFAEQEWKVWKNHPVLKDYVVRKDLGEGAFSVVVAATKKADPRQWVALKVVFMQAPTVLDDPEILELMRKEAQLLNMLDHPNVVRCLEVVETDAQLVIVLEYLGGGPLLNQLGKVGDAYTAAQAAAMFRQIASGLAHMHEYGVLHRDVKPENCIFVDELVACLRRGGTPRIKLIDLGMACLYDPTHPVKGALGSPGFVAPEVVEGEEHTPAMDVFSAGVILFIMLVGRKPFNLQQCEDLSYAVWPLASAPGLLDTKWLALPVEARELVLGMLEYDPLKRLTIQQVLESPWLSEEATPEASDISLSDVGKRASLLASVRRERHAVQGAVALLPGEEGSVRGAARKAYVARFKQQVAAEKSSRGYRDDGSGRGISHMERMALSLARMSHTRMHDQGRVPDKDSDCDISMHIRPYRDRSRHGPPRAGGTVFPLGSVHGAMFGPPGPRTGGNGTTLPPMLRPSRSAGQLARDSSSKALVRSMRASVGDLLSLTSSGDMQDGSTRNGGRLGSLFAGWDRSLRGGNEAAIASRTGTYEAHQGLLGNRSAHGSQPGIHLIDASIREGSVHRTIPEGGMLHDAGIEPPALQDPARRLLLSHNGPPLPPGARGGEGGRAGKNPDAGLPDLVTSNPVRSLPVLAPLPVLDCTEGRRHGSSDLAGLLGATERK